MKTLNFLIAIPFLFFLFVLPENSSAKEFEIPVIRVEVFIQPDGDVRIVEHRTYLFEGSFSWADYRLPLNGFTAIRNIKISSNGNEFINRNNEKPGTFTVERNDDVVRMKWFYEAEDEKRTFTISYILEGAIVVGPEWTEFFWNYISADREKDTQTLQIQFHLPQAIGNDSLFVRKRGARSKISITEKTAGYTVTATNLDDDEFVKIRSVFPRSVFNEAEISTTNPDFSLATARADEQAYQAEQARQQKRDERYAGYGRLLIIIVSGLSILAFLFFYRKYGRRYTVKDVSSKETITIPGDLKPAAAGWLMAKRNTGSNHLMATLLDLARRKHFLIKEQEPEKKWMQDDKKIFTIETLDVPESDELTSWEADLKDFVSKQIENENNRIDKLFSKNAYSSNKWFNKWKKKLKKYCKAKNWYDPESIKGMKLNMVVQVPLLALAILATVWAGPVGIIAILITLTFFLLSLAIIRRTPEGEKIYTKWKAYKEGLKNVKGYSINKELLGKHFIYAVALGLSKKNIEGIMDQYDASAGAFYWFVFYGNGAQGAANISATFSTLAASGTAAAPGTGAGAGAAAGAAGGGAAGGAG